MPYVSLSKTNDPLAPHARRWRVPAWAKLANKVLDKLSASVSFGPRFDHREDMVSMEQVSNLTLLIEDLLDRNVPGDFVELGCYTGSTTVLFGQLLAANGTTRKLHAFDRFDIELSSVTDIEQRFTERFLKAGLPLPVIHAGDLLITAPAELPERIAFAHVDLGTGGSVDDHAHLVKHGLNALYPRLATGAVVVLMDYHAPGYTVGGNDSNPGMLLGCETFFQDKPERVHLLYGGPCSHAYFRKQ
jgi:O-methyltransferase